MITPGASPPSRQLSINIKSLPLIVRRSISQNSSPSKMAVLGQEASVGFGSASFSVEALSTILRPRLGEIVAFISRSLS
jgi:hypothetical protein